MDIVERLAQWAENDMRVESIALEAKHEIELLRKQFELSRDLGMKWMDEIERLREALKEILTHETDYEPYDCIEIARAALKGDE
jgi:uncharacterized membrane protein